MSSTDLRWFAAAAGRFFDQKLMAAARAMRARGREPFPRGPDPLLATYYVRRPKTVMEPADFELPALDSPEGLARGLREFWERRASEELAPLADEIAELALGVRSREEQTDEVSPFIYVMF